jgi:hypothetical protein
MFFDGYDAAVQILGMAGIVFGMAWYGWFAVKGTDETPEAELDADVAEWTAAVDDFEVTK